MIRLQILKRTFSNKPLRWIFLGVATGIVGGLLLGIFRGFGDDAERLLAKAYADRRTIELRISGAPYASMRQERGRTDLEINQPESLVEAKLAIIKHLKQNPNEPTWLQANARAELLNHNFESALSNLHRALESRPDSPELLTDLASGYFERAQTTDQAIDYGTAIEYLGEVLAKTPDNTIALFNRAIVCEKMFLYAQAIDDWEHYLKVDPAGNWSNDARSRLSQLRLKIEEQKQAMAEPLATPSELAKLNVQNINTLRKTDTRIEEYLAITISKWLPTAYPLNLPVDTHASQARYALKLFATWLEEKHGDYWLGDLLTTSSSPNFSSAVAALSKAMEENNDGDTTAALHNAQDAYFLFTTDHNTAGALRARVEYIFATHLTQNGVNCLRAANESRQAIERSPYLWVKGQYHLETGTCYWLNGNLGKARDFYQLASVEADSGGYGALYLRSQDHLAGLEGTSGDFRASWERIHNALKRFWSGSYLPMRGYNLYYNLHESARVRKQPYLQVSTWTDGLALSESFNDHALRAMAHSLMANAAMAAGQPENAEREFKSADQLFELSPPVQSTRVARLEASVRLSEAEIEFAKVQHEPLQQEQLQQASNHLKELEPEISQLSDNFLSLLFYSDLGEVEARLHNTRPAESALQAAIAFSEFDLHSLKDERSKAEWSQKSSAAYRNLVELKLHQGESANALEIWEWYRGSDLRSVRAIQFPHSPSKYFPANAKQSVPIFSEVTKQLPALKDITVLSYVHLRDGYIVWVYDDRGIFTYTLPALPARIDALARNFLRLCSDSNSDLNLVRRQARTLYDLLISPVEGRLSSGRSLVIETDGALNGIAFEALLDKQGHYLVDRSPMSYSQGAYYSAHLHPLHAITIDSKALIVTVSMPRIYGNILLQPLPDVESEGVMVKNKFRSTQLLSGKDAALAKIRSQLSNAAIFHFAGHAVASESQTGLLLSDGALNYESLSDIDLSQMQLAVLSACNTTGDVDDADYNPDSLVHLFISAGVPRIVVSRWNVDSAATKRFMQLFYGALLNGEAAAHALRSAELGLRNQPHMPHPYYWSAFTTFSFE
jgi:CHAT domain-containing protein